MENYVFNIKNLELNWRVRLRGWWVARKDRKMLAKRFALETGLVYPLSKNQKPHLPEEYLVEGKELERLDIIRNRIIIGQYERYKKIAKELDIAGIEKSDLIKSNKEYLSEVEASYKKNKEDYKKEKDAQKRIYLEHNIATLGTKVKNLKKENESEEAFLMQLAKQRKENAKTWAQQVETIEKMIDEQKNRYIQSASKKIQDDLNFTKFVFAEVFYDDEMLPAVKGEIDV